VTISRQAFAVLPRALPRNKRKLLFMKYYLAGTGFHAVGTWLAPV
jgi:hypothetical protein